MDDFLSLGVVFVQVTSTANPCQPLPELPWQPSPKKNLFQEATQQQQPVTLCLPPSPALHPCSFVLAIHSFYSSGVCVCDIYSVRSFFPSRLSISAFYPSVPFCLICCHSLSIFSHRVSSFVATTRGNGASGSFSGLLSELPVCVGACIRERVPINGRHGVARARQGTAVCTSACTRVTAGSNYFITC